MDSPFVCVVLRVLHFSNTRRTDVLAFEMNNLVSLAAEDTSWFVLLQDDSITIHVDFQGIFFTDAKRAAELDGNYNTTQFVNLAYDACRFHCTIPVQKFVFLCIVLLEVAAPARDFYRSTRSKQLLL